jgi:AGZA family xanthine/uracil permease-like MFS transporter
MTSNKQRSIIVFISIGIGRDLITATAVIAGISSFAFGFFTNLPVALA